MNSGYSCSCSVACSGVYICIECMSSLNVVLAVVMAAWNESRRNVEHAMHAVCPNVDASSPIVRP